MKIGFIVIHCHDFDRTVAFWQAALHYVPREPAKDGWVVLRDPENRGPNLSFQGRDRRPRSRSWLHLDLYTADQQTEVEDWSLWERDDIPGGIVLKTTSLCLRTREAPSSASCRRLTCRAIRARGWQHTRPTAMARDKGGFPLDRGRLRGG
jgi:Glyoxalase-like domain